MSPDQWEAELAEMAFHIHACRVQARNVRRLAEQAETPERYLELLAAADNLSACTDDLAINMALLRDMRAEL